MYAVIQTGGKQYKVAEGDRLDVELLSGDDVDLQPVLLVDGASVLSTPSDLSGVSVSCADRRPRQGPEDPRLHVQEQVEPAAPLGAPPALLHDRDHRDLEELGERSFNVEEEGCGVVSQRA